MIATIIIIILALLWLAYETDYFTIRLESTEYQQALKAREEYGKSPMGDINNESDSTPYKPSVFTPLDMPEFTGTLNIICDKYTL